jgi:hypothetical protein
MVTYKIHDFKYLRRRDELETHRDCDYWVQLIRKRMAQLIQRRMAQTRSDFVPERVRWRQPKQQVRRTCQTASSCSPEVRTSLYCTGLSRRSWRSP